MIDTTSINCLTVSPLRARITRVFGEAELQQQPPRYQKAVVEACRTMQHAIHQNAVDHGWWDEPREDGTVLALIHAEVSECLEALREGNPEDKQCPGFSHAEVELADAALVGMGADGIVGNAQGDPYHAL